MGDRGNICIQEKGNKIFFYSHWTGHSLFSVLQEALKRGRDRWDDEPYLARIIFCQMIKNDVLDNTGFGISTYLTDNEYPILVVDSNTRTVSLDDEEWSFQEFIELDEDPRIS
jgi:hypothetical protein